MEINESGGVQYKVEKYLTIYSHSPNIKKYIKID